MSELKLNIIDADRAICGKIHGSVAEATVAALCAEPETIGELQDAVARFIKPLKNFGPFEGFETDISDEPWDAGIIFIDLVGRMVAGESTYIQPCGSGRIQCHGGTRREVSVPYCVSDDWLFVGSIDEYKAICELRRAKRSAVSPLDARPILYEAVVGFIVRECLEARESKADDPIAEIHAKWLTTARPDLRGRSPRDLLLAKLDFIDGDLQSREHQWGLTGEPPPCLSPDSAAYRFAGFGTHEVVVYYELLRHLLENCWKRVRKAKGLFMADEISRLTQVKTHWMESPREENEGRSPAYILECERKRLPLIVAPEEAIVDDDCPICRAMAKSSTPMFMHLDGCNMDDDFPFSLCRTREEWEAEERRRKDFDEEFESTWKNGKSAAFDNQQAPEKEDVVIQ